VFIPYGPSTAEEYKRRLMFGNKLLDSSLRVIVEKKSKLVAWVVSRCNVPSGRDEYVNELKRYVDVDVYGKCGFLKCDNKSSDSENLKPTIGCCKLISCNFLKVFFCYLLPLFAMSCKMKCWEKIINSIWRSKTRYVQTT